MFWISLIIVILLALECYSLFKKKLMKKSIRFILVTLVYIVINFLMLFGSVKVNYSSILYLLNSLANNPIFTILEILINIVLYGYICKEMINLRKKRKQNKKIFLGILGIYLIYDILLIFVLFHSIMIYVLLILFISIIVLLIKKYLKTHQNYVLIIILLLGLFTYYSYFTYGGSARLQIAMQGYPFSAYTTGLEELTHLKEKNVRQYYPIKSIPVESGDMGIILVKNYIGLKISHYIGF